MFEELLEGGGGRMFDVQFNFLNDVGDISGEIKAHKLLLSLLSPVFRDRLLGDKNRDEVSRDNIEKVEIKECGFLSFKAFIRYLYSGDATIFNGLQLNDLIQLFLLADQYQVCGLKQLVRSFIKKAQIDPLVEILELLLKYHGNLVLEEICNDIYRSIVNKNLIPIEFAEIDNDENEDCFDEVDTNTEGNHSSTAVSGEASDESSTDELESADAGFTGNIWDEFLDGMSLGNVDSDEDESYKPPDNFDEKVEDSEYDTDEDIIEEEELAGLMDDPKPVAMRFLMPTWFKALSNDERFATERNNNRRNAGAGKQWHINNLLQLLNDKKPKSAIISNKSDGILENSDIKAEKFDEKSDKSDGKSERSDEKADKSNENADKSDESADKSNESADKSDENAEKSDENADMSEKPDEKSNNQEEKAERSDEKVDKPDEQAKRSDEKSYNPDEKANRQNEKAVRFDEKDDKPDERADKPDEKAYELDEKYDVAEDKVDKSDEKSHNDSDKNSDKLDEISDKELDDKSVKESNETSEEEFRDDEVFKELMVKTRASASPDALARAQLRTEIADMNAIAEYAVFRKALLEERIRIPSLEKVHSETINQKETEMRYFVKNYLPNENENPVKLRWINIMYP